MKRTVSPTRKAVIGFTIGATLAFASWAQADVAFIKEKPSTTITIGQAMKSKTIVAKCDKVKMGNSGRPKKVTGSTTFWLQEMPKQDDSALEVLADGKSVIQCKSNQFDLEKGSMRGASAE